jgi:hypothetical protein
MMRDIRFLCAPRLRHAPQREALLSTPPEAQGLDQSDDERRSATTDVLLARRLARETILAALAAVGNCARLLPSVDAGGITFDRAPAARKAENRKQKAETASPFRFLFFALCFPQPALVSYRWTAHDLMSCRPPALGS